MRTVRSRVQRFRIAQSSHHIIGRGHAAGDDPDRAGIGGRGALAVHHRFLPVVLFAPGKVVVVLHLQHHFGTQIAHDPVVNQLVVGRSIPAHQFHGVPVVLTFFTVEHQSRQRRQAFHCPRPRQCAGRRRAKRVKKRATTPM